MNLQPRADRKEGREPKEHCLNLDGTNGSLSDISDSCTRQHSVEAAASPTSVGQPKLVEIMEANKTCTKDILEHAKLKLIEACIALEADYKTVMCTIEEFRAIESKAARINFDCDIVKLNVGGQIFNTSMETFKKYGPNLFTQILSGEGNVRKCADGSYFFDRDGFHFRHILNYMRHGNVPDYVVQQHKNELLLEAEYYGLNSLVDYLHNGDAVSASIEKAKYVGEGSSCISVLKSPGIIDEVFGCLNKACISLDGDITNNGSRERQNCKADLCVPHEPNEIVKLNVGGVFFQTSLSTLMKDKDSLLFSLVTGRLNSCQSDDGYFYMDRDGKRFKHILNFLRDGLIPQKVFCEMGEELMIEASFFEISSLKTALTLLMHQANDSNVEKLSMKEDVDTNTNEMHNPTCKRYDASLGDSLDKKITEIVEESYERIAKKLDSFAESDVLQATASKHSTVTETLKALEKIHEKIIDMMRLFVGCFEEDGGRQIQDALADCKKSVESCRNKVHFNPRPIPIPQPAYREDSKYLTHNPFRCTVARSSNESIKYVTSTEDIKQFIKTSLQSAFEQHEDKMELEKIVHNHPLLCAFSKSKILQDCNEYKAHLHKFLFETNHIGYINLIYSWKQDGADSFHDICDNSEPTLTLVKANTGNIFGGYTMRYWNEDARYTMSDPKAFVFSLKNRQGTKPFLKVSNGGCIKVGHPGGPVFGKKSRSRFKAEFLIDEDDAVSSISGGFTLWGKYTTLSAYMDHINLAGSEKFSVDDMEVFTIRDI